MKSFFLALQFLTSIPLPQIQATRKEFGRSSFFFPFVGLLFGGALLAFDLVLESIFPVPVARILVLVAQVLVYGAFHLDGLADSADGLYGGRNRNEALRIMRDPRVGTMGVLALLLLLLVKTISFLTLPAPVFRRGLILAPVMGHGAMVLALVVPYARRQGLGRTFADHRWAGDWIVALVFMVSMSWFLFKGNMLMVWGATILGIGTLLSLAWRKIRGITGDLCGAVEEVAETLTFVALSAVAKSRF